MQDNALKWFDSYLCPRGYRVKINDSWSEYKELHQSVPQGSCSVSQLYSVFASTMQYVPIWDVNGNGGNNIALCDAKSDIDLNSFADDHSINKDFNPNVLEEEYVTLVKMEKTLCNINNWMCKNDLCMNGSKTDYLYTGSKVQLNKCTVDSINVCGNTVKRSKAIKLLGTILDEQLSFKTHIVQKCKSAMYGLLQIKHIRCYLTREACELLVHGLVISHIDYCNSLFAGLPDVDIGKLQRVQNTAVKVILQKTHYDSVTVCLKELHWLPVRSRIDHKILGLVYDALNCTGPKYMQELLTLYEANP